MPTCSFPPPHTTSSPRLEISHSLSPPSPLAHFAYSYCEMDAYPTFVDGKMFLDSSTTMVIEIFALLVLVIHFGIEKEYLGDQVSAA